MSLPLARQARWRAPGLVAGLLLLAAGCTSTPADAPTAPSTPPEATAAVSSPTPSSASAAPSATPSVPTTPLAAIPTVEPPPPVIPDPALTALLEGLLDGTGDSYGVYVKNLTDGSGAAVNADRVFPAASVFKLFVMWEAFREQALGLIGFDDVMQVTPYYKSWELGTNAVQVGDLVTVDQALRLMMSISDTPTAVLLQDTMGFENVNAGLEALGIRNSGLFYPGPPLVTARDAAVLLQDILRGGILPQASHDAMLDLLRSERTDSGLRAGVPAEVDVAHKTGSLPDALHDAGIVFLPGSPFVIVILWDRQSGADLIQTISERVYEYYATR
jgi:beta-lactamase class A